MKRWLVRFIAVALLLVVGALVTTHLVLRSDFPRTLVLNILRDQTGLRVDAANLQTSWFGYTTITDLEIGLPMENDPFITVPEIRVRHAALLKLVLTRSLDLAALDINEPFVRLEAQPDGQWNLLEAAEIVTLTRQRQAPSTAPPPALPLLRIHDATVDVVMPDGEILRYEPFIIEGNPDGPLAWDFMLSLEQRIALSGRLSPNSGWAHQINFDVDQIRSMIEPWLPEAPERLNVRGNWQGQVRGSALSGTLALDQLQVDTIDAQARIGIRVIGFDIEAEPQSIVVRMENGPVDQFRVDSGRLLADRDGIRADRIIVASQGVLAQIDGSWILDTNQGDLSVHWRADRAVTSIEHTGSLRAGLNFTPLSTIEVSAEVESTGIIQDYEWQVAFDIGAAGETWQSLRAAITAPRLQLEGPDTRIDLAGTSAKLRTTWPLVTLSDLQLPTTAVDTDELVTRPARLNGRFNADTLRWTLALSAQDWIPPAVFRGQQASPVTIDIGLSGDQTHAALEAAAVRYQEFTLAAEGNLQFEDLALRLEAALEASAPQIVDRVRVEAANVTSFIEGTLDPIALQVNGAIGATGVTYEDRPIEGLSVPYRATVTPERAQLTADTFSMLGGRWDIRAGYELQSNDATADIRFDAVSIADLAQLVNVPISVSGTVSAAMVASLPVSQPAETQLVGSWSIADFDAGGFALIQGGGRARINNRLVQLSQMLLTHDDGQLAGSAQINLDRPDMLQADLRLTDWPLVLDEYNLSVVAGGSAQFELDLVRIAADGLADLTLDLTYLETPIGTATVLAGLDGRIIDLTSLQASAFSGTARGHGSLHLSPQHWTQSTLNLEWSEIDLAQFQTVVEALDPLQGISSGRVAINRATDPRATLPMQIELHADFTNGRFQELSLGYPTDESPDLFALIHFGPDLFQIDRGTLAAAGGTLDLFGRLTRHGEEYNAFVNLMLNRIDLQQLASAASLNDQPMPGIVNGEWSLGGSLFPPHRIFGNARLLLSESDLLALPGIAQVYGALRLDIGTSLPTGEGELLLRLEGDALEITRLTYFNRGTDILASLRIENIWEAADSPISGTAVGAIRPLRGTNLPFFEIVDRMIQAAQSNAAAVQIEGSVSAPEAEIVPLQEITSAIRRLIRGRVD